MTKLNPLAHTSDNEYPRPPTPDEFTAIFNLAAYSMYGEAENNREERHDLNLMLQESLSAGRFIVSYGSSDTPGYFGPMIFVIWPDTSVTMYRRASMDLPSFTIWEGDYYETDAGGMPWVSS